MTKGLVALVESKTAITDSIGTSPTRFYPRLLPQGLSDFPASAFRVNNNIDTADFSGASKYDYGYVDIWSYGRKNGQANYEQAYDLYELLRSELVGSSGTYNGIVIDDVFYMPSGDEDHLEDLELYTKRLELKINYRR